MTIYSYLHIYWQLLEDLQIFFTLCCLIYVIFPFVLKVIIKVIFYTLMNWFLIETVHYGDELV
jgi:hypothetical protein